jgi:hypothetical protein
VQGSAARNDMIEKITWESGKNFSGHLYETSLSEKRRQDIAHDVNSEWQIL